MGLRIYLDNPTILFYNLTMDIHLKSSAHQMWLVSPQTGQKIAMTPQPDGWCTASLAPEAHEFYFESAEGETLNLGGTMGNYPADPAENFSASHRPLWVKNGALYSYNPETQSKPVNELVVLTINLHTYQEEEQEDKFDRIAQAIAELDADVVFLQEAAQHKDAQVVDEQFGVVIKQDNMARILVGKLTAQHGCVYHYFWDWAHYGWDVWEEGCAILTKHPINEAEARYITGSTKPTSWRTRKVPRINITHPCFGQLNLYSAHTGRWDDEHEPFKGQADQLLAWLKEKNDRESTTLLAGDFNNVAGSVGYDYLVSQGQLDDLYFKANPSGFDDASIGGNIHGWEDVAAEGMRIDYIFMPHEASQKVELILAQRIFTQKSYGRVSDHNGQYARLKGKT